MMELDEALRKSGEDTARLAERLRAGGEDRNKTASELLIVSATHMKCLEAAGMGCDALATGVMTLLTIIHTKINPEEIADVYTAFLQDLYILSLRLCQSAPDSHTAEHLMEISMRLGALSIVTFKALCQGDGHHKALGERNGAFEEMFQDAPAEFWQFQERPIMPQSAIDILSDATARLASLGYVD